MSYIWKLPQKPSQDFIDKFPELHPIVVQLLYNRNLKTQDEIDEFLSPDYSQDVHDPHLFKDMDKAVLRVIKAIDKKEGILIYGDNDVDGMTAAALLTEFLQFLRSHKRFRCRCFFLTELLKFKYDIIPIITMEM